MKASYSEKAKVMRSYRFVLPILLALLLSACTSQTPDPAQPVPTETQKTEPTPLPSPTAMPDQPAPTPIGPDYWPTEGWRTSTPEEQGMDSELLAEALDFLQEQIGFNIHSLLIIRNGHVVTNAYFYPVAQSRSLYDLASATKSATGTTLVGRLEE